MGGPPAPPPPLLPPAREAPAALSVEAVDAGKALLPQQETPTPKAKMKTINWNKIPNNKVVGKHNIWSLVARSHQHTPMADLDWAEMEGLFCQQVPPAPVPQSSPRLGREPQDTDKRRRESSEIALLDGKRSLNVNIFLKQFRSCNEDIIHLICNGEHDDIGAEKLRGLLKILPEVDELEMLRSFDGEKSKLGTAEKFLLQLIQVPNYKLRIESMLLKEEFAANMGYLEPSINAMIVAGEDVMSNKSLQEVLYMVIVAGNFLNSGGYAGNAAGVKLSSLQKLTDIRANKPGMNLIHYVAMQAEKKRKDLIKFPEEMSILEEATKTTIEQLQNEINALDSRIKKVQKQINLPSTEDEIKSQMLEFLQMAEQEVSGLQRDMEELESVRQQLSEFFCEDVGTFKVEECFKVLYGFCTKFRQAALENERRRIQEEQATFRRKQREEQLAAKRRQMSGADSSECTIVDSLLYDIRSGFTQNKPLEKEMKMRRLHNGSMTSEDDVSITGSPLLTRRRMGSFSGPSGDQASGKDDNCSPDVTPNGSLRRRRSRVPSEDDDSNLMDFLRSSGHDSNRERKSWGSLDRSWARRARGSGRKRPELLSADFSGDRERPSSPSPLSENKPEFSPAAEQESKPKAWKQKIEAWLQGNEEEEKQNDELRRRSRRIQNNRRSLEADSESEGRSTLDTLPEEKSTQQSQQSTYQRVYPDWRPTIEKTDIVGAMEAIEEVQPQISVKDKSPWRKSNLNVSNSAEDMEMDNRRLRRMKSRGSVDPSGAVSSLQAIKEERKHVIGHLGQSGSGERLTLYLRRPSDGPETQPASCAPLLQRPAAASDDNRHSPHSHSSAHGLHKHLHSKDGADGSLKASDATSASEKVEKDTGILGVPAPRRLRKARDEINTYDRIEIDSDNIETPPAVRKSIHSKEMPEENSRRTLSRFESFEDRNSKVNTETRCKRLLDEESRNEKSVENKFIRSPQRFFKAPDKRSGEEEEILGDGQFDRFSSTRRTRRYKKLHDVGERDIVSGDDHTGEEISTATTCTELVAEKNILRPFTLQSESEQVNLSKCEDTEARLKKWQDRLKYRERGEGDGGRLTEEAIAHITSAGEELQNLHKMQRSSKNITAKEAEEYPEIPSVKRRMGSAAHRERGKSMIEPWQVAEALKLSKQSANLSEKGASETLKSSVLKSKKDVERSQLPIRRTFSQKSKKSNEINQPQTNSNFIPEIRIQTLTPSSMKSNTARSEHELNDEGFEETQSLVSETPSQGTSSGFNYEIDVTDTSPGKSSEYKSSTRQPVSNLIRADSCGSADTSSSNNVPSLSDVKSASVQYSSKPVVRNDKFKYDSECSSKMRTSKRAGLQNSPIESSSNKSNGAKIYRENSVEPIKRVTPLRSASLRKTDSQSSITKGNVKSQQKKRGVERSNSRNSLRSSRSSLNSAVSVKTVRNAPPVSKSSSHLSIGGTARTNFKMPGYTSSGKANVEKESEPKLANVRYQGSINRKNPLVPVQLKTAVSGRRSVPASRSSSSGSSISSTIRRPRVTTGVSTSFKENTASGIRGASESSIPASRSSSSGSSIGNTVSRPHTSMTGNASFKENTTKNGVRQNLPHGLSFMRPTAASAAKDSVTTKDSSNDLSNSKIRITPRFVK